MMDEIKILRGEIDEIDETIVELLEKRLIVVKKIGKLKYDVDMDLTDLNREKEIFKKHSRSSLDTDFVIELFELIIKYCKGEEQKTRR